MVSNIYPRITRLAPQAGVEHYASAFGSERVHLLHVVDKSTGLDKLSESPSPSAFWEHVREILVRGRGDKYIITELLLGGENVTNPDSRAVVKEALCLIT